MRDEFWAAVRDEPPTLNGEPLRRPERSGGLATALVATGFGYDADVRAAQAEDVTRLLPRVRDIRRLGSAALDLAWTAAGRYDAFYERGIKLWDIAAGELICQSAGLAHPAARARAARGGGHPHRSGRAGGRARLTGRLIARRLGYVLKHAYRRSHRVLCPASHPRLRVPEALAPP